MKAHTIKTESEVNSIEHSKKHDRVSIESEAGNLWFFDKPGALEGVLPGQRVIVTVEILSDGEEGS